ncbi:MAG: hypothetical protein GY801_44395, partial [bacterium]|nr:hypothetical protein [bacterium]
PHVTHLKRSFIVTHPFHPRYRNEYERLSYRRSWGSEYIEFIDEKGQASSIPIAWTDAADIEPIVALSKGRCAFQVMDLLRLADLIDDLDAPNNR